MPSLYEQVHLKEGKGEKSDAFYICETVTIWKKIKINNDNRAKFEPILRAAAQDGRRIPLDVTPYVENYQGKEYKGFWLNGLPE